jgi:hypothetical protein
MNLKKYQTTICNSLLIEKIINVRIENKIMQNQKINSINIYYNGLLKRKKRINEIYKGSLKAGIELDINNILSNIDIWSTKDVLQEFTNKLPAYVPQKEFIVRISQTEISEKLIRLLVNCKSQDEFNKIIEPLPAAFLIKHRILKTKDYSISTIKSVKSINTPMRG